MYNNIEKIKITKKRNHLKASERYVDVIFSYDDGSFWEGSIPIEYRRTGIELHNESEVLEYLTQVSRYCHSKQREEWLRVQEVFWDGKAKARVTKEFFDALTTFEWTCVSCQMPKNPNWARRIQDLKEFGYTIATHTARLCQRCNIKNTHLIIVPIPRGGLSGYETWSPDLRKRIVDVLQSYDAYEGKLGKKEQLLPDHKFPEIRWGNNTRRESLENLTDEEIKKEFQLMSNQRNLQKREICRQCYQNDQRGFPFGIKFYYYGDALWSTGIPKSGKEAETGCVGCGWYDLEAWRTTLNQTIASFDLSSNQ
ncbi:MAG: hypothetical protein SAK29_15725 [Scytonema sp. PMC 1069.18]|nr:hypothetical protein [Scytonema sp. PMC 1069.18]MEC4886456.1 hypothetical protein [Scytonema sp. PMC 1070.18]